MTQNEMLKVIYDDVRGLKGDFQELKDDVKVLKDDVKVLKDDVQVLKDDVQVLKGKVQGLEDDVQSLKGGFRELTDKVQVLDGNVKDLQLTLENETNRNIRIIAEGHLDLNRKLDAALQTDSQKELMQLRVNILENDMRKVKEKVGIA